MAREPRTIVRLPVSFQREKGCVIAVFHIDESNTLGFRFESPNELLSFCSQLLDEASLVWPQNTWMQEYLKED